MGFEVTPTPLGRGGGRDATALVAVAAVALAVAAVAVMTSGPEPPPGAEADVAPPEGAVSQTFGSGSRPTPGHVMPERSPPSVVDCTDAPPGTCAIVLEAALGLLTPDLPAVERAVVSRSIVCGDTFDCPPHHLRRMVGRVGSVTLDFVDQGPSAWINVLYRQRGRPADAPPMIHAWIARWVARPLRDR
jgi:hypothetical protein